MAGVNTPRSPAPQPKQSEEPETLGDRPKQTPEPLLKADPRTAAYHLAAAELESKYREERQEAQSTIMWLEARRRELLENNRELAAQSARYRAELEIQRNSTSWRITAPMRLCKVAFLRAAIAAAKLVGFSARSLPSTEADASPVQTPKREEEVSER